jgi:hypothetical protein
MPDIISRIRLEAEGADQAAREILKLKAAYEEAATAAKGLSAEVGTGRDDPFAQSIRGDTRTGTLGADNQDILARESRNKLQSDMARERESANSALRPPQAINQSLAVAEAIGQGRGGAAASGMAGGIGSLLGGPLGVGLLAGAALLTGAQKMADKSFSRLENVFGTGMSQRLGMSASDADAQIIGFSRMGVPEQMVQSFFQAASQAGVDMRKDATQGAVNTAMLGSVAYGIDPTAMAGLIGAANRAKVNAENVAGERMLAMAEQSFGRPDVGMFTQSMQGMIESAMGRGVEMTSDTVNAMSVTMAALAQFGGFSSTGAAQFAGKLQERGVAAAGLQKPEDVVAFQAMRDSGMSVTDTMLAMERDPMEVNRRVMEYLKKTSGDNQDLLRLRVQSYLGAGTSMSAVDRFIETHTAMGAFTTTVPEPSVPTVGTLPKSAPLTPTESVSYSIPDSSLPIPPEPAPRIPPEPAPRIAPEPAPRIDRSIPTIRAISEPVPLVLPKSEVTSTSAIPAIPVSGTLGVRPSDISEPAPRAVGKTVSESEGTGTTRIDYDAMANRLGAGRSILADMDTEMQGVVKTYAVRQNEMLKEFSDTLLTITTGMSKAFQDMFGRSTIFDPKSMRPDGTGLWQNAKFPTTITAEQVTATVGTADRLTVENVGVLEIPLQALAQTNPAAAKATLNLMGDIGVASTGPGTSSDAAQRAAAVVAANEEGSKAWKGVQDAQEFLKRSPVKSATNVSRSLEADLSKAKDAPLDQVMGALQYTPRQIVNEVMGSLITGIETDTKANTRKGFLGLGGLENPEANRALGELQKAIVQAFGGLSLDREISIEGMADMLETLKGAIREKGFVYTDGRYEYVGAP